MPHVHVTGWRPGLRTIGLTKVFRREARVPLDAAKAMTDALVAGEPQAVAVESEARAAAVAREVRGLGAVAEVRP